MSKFLSNLIKLSTATLVAQFLGFIITPVLSRLYSPADFGVYQLFYSIVSVISIISCLSYHNAINLPKKDEDAAGIVVLCLILIAITVVATLAVTLAFSGYFGHLLSVPGFSIYLFILPLAIICNSIAYVLAFWLARREEFGTVAKANLISSFSGKGISVGYGIISPSPFGLIFGTVINDATIAVITVRKTLADVHLFKTVSYEKIRQVAYRYKEFPQFNAISNITNTAGVNSIPFLLIFFFSPVVVGYYSMANLVINIPSKLVGNALETVFFQKASVEKNLTGSIKKVVKAVHTRLISIGMFCCIVVIIIGPELFSFVLGIRWSTAGVYAQILTPWFFVSFISIPLMSVINVLEKQRVYLAFNVLLMVSIVIALTTGGFMGDPLLAIILLSGTGFIFWSWMNLYILKISEVTILEALREIFRYLVFSLCMCLPLIIAKFYSLPSNVLILIAVVISGLYYLIIVYNDEQFKEGLIQFAGNILKK